MESHMFVAQYEVLRYGCMAFTVFIGLGVPC